MNERFDELTTPVWTSALRCAAKTSAIIHRLVHARLCCALALGIGPSLSLPAAAADSADIPPPKTSHAIPWSQLGAKAGADYQGHGLAVSPTADGARLRCHFQRLEGEATREGLWLTSTLTNAMNDRFRVVAVAVARVGGNAGSPGSADLQSALRLHVRKITAASLRL